MYAYVCICVFLLYEFWCALPGYCMRIYNKSHWADQQVCIIHQLLNLLNNWVNALSRYIEARMDRMVFASVCIPIRSNRIHMFINSIGNTFMKYARFTHMKYQPYTNKQTKNFQSAFEPKKNPKKNFKLNKKYSRKTVALNCLIQFLVHWMAYFSS